MIPHIAGQTGLQSMFGGPKEFQHASSNGERAGLGGPHLEEDAPDRPDVNFGPTQL